MKVAEKITLPASKEDVWNILTGLNQYAEWHPFLTSVKGNLEFGGQIELLLKLPGKPGKTRQAIVSGFADRKYLSFSYASGAGHWWLSGEHIFRIVPTGDNAVDFFNEAYYYGLSLRFSKDKMKMILNRALSQMNQALKERCEA